MKCWGEQTHHKGIGRVEPECHGEILRADEADDEIRRRRNTGGRARPRARGQHARLASQQVGKRVAELLADAVLGVGDGVAHEARGRDARVESRQLGRRANQQRG
jgi:hypothetical protein